MIKPLAQVTADALALTPEERGRLISRLLEEDAPPSGEWMAEITRRIQEIEDGMETIPADEFFAEARRKFDEARSLSPGG